MDSSVVLIGPVMEGMIGLGKESRDRVFGEKDLEGISINEAVNVREKHKAINEQGKDRLENKGALTSVSFTN